jgi:hypothetical protein
MPNNVISQVLKKSSGTSLNVESPTDKKLGQVEIERVKAKQAKQKRKRSRDPRRVLIACEEIVSRI